MYKNELDKHIQNKSCSNSAVLFGESPFLIDRYTQHLSKKVDASILSFYFDEYNFDSAKAHLSQASLFGDRNVLVIKTEKKVTKKELEILFGLCDKNSENIFIYAYLGSDYKLYNNKKTFEKFRVMSVRFFHPKPYEAQNILSKLAEDEGVKIDKYTISHLLNIHNFDISLASNELKKLSVYDKEITTKDVDTLVYGLGEINLDDFIKNLIEKKDFRENLKNILEHNNEEIKIVTAITTYITTLYMFNIYIKVNGVVNARDILGYPAPKHIVDQKASLAIKIKPHQYLQLKDGICI